MITKTVDVFGYKIGVLGGIGPESTGEFYSKLISKLQKSGIIKNNTDFPQIIINSIPAPELIHNTITKEELQAYILGLKELDSFDVDFIVMVCNTIHLYYDFLQNEINTPIIDLRLEVKEYINEQKIKSAFILGTPETIKNGLYEFDDFKMIMPDENEQKQLSNSIFLFNKGINKSEQIKKTRKIYKKYISDEVTHILLGCTEFAVMLENETIPKINTIDVLVDFVSKKIQRLHAKKLGD